MESVDFYTHLLYSIPLPPSPPGSLQPGWQPVYVRFGDLPPGGRSFDYHMRTYAPGVSAFRGYKVSETHYLVDLQGDAALTSCYLGIKHRPAYVLYGEELCLGVSLEPILRVEQIQAIPATAKLEPTAEIPEEFVRAWRAGEREEIARRRLLGYAP